MCCPRGTGHRPLSEIARTEAMLAAAPARARNGAIVTDLHCSVIEAVLKPEREKVSWDTCT
jgi:hypothetical protein